jgi:RimJ/RimL family protein N-acetyltransferase
MPAVYGPGVNPPGTFAGGHGIIDPRPRRIAITPRRGAVSWQHDVVDVTFEPVQWPSDAPAVAAFLTSSEWPFHGTAKLTSGQAASVAIADDDTASFWIRRASRAIGLIRLLDLSDVAEGSPLFDLRLADTQRGRGIGPIAVRWLTSHLFAEHPELMRIEATTRHDNTAMQRVLDRCGYRQEGRLVEAWVSANGSRFDTLIYAILRREWALNPSSGR